MKKYKMFKYIVFYVLNGRMRERALKNRLVATAFKDSVNGSLCRV